MGEIPIGPQELRSLSAKVPSISGLSTNERTLITALLDVVQGLRLTDSLAPGPGSGSTDWRLNLSAREEGADDRGTIRKIGSSSI